MEKRWQGAKRTDDITFKRNVNDKAKILWEIAELAQIGKEACLIQQERKDGRARTSNAQIVRASCGDTHANARGGSRVWRGR